MRKLFNPYIKMEGYQCFGCSPTNKNGLNLMFFEDGEFIVSSYEPKDFLQGYFNVVHGGIQATLLDEIASWVVFVKAQTGGVTSSMSIKYRKPAYVKDKLTLKAKLVNKNKRFASIEAKLYNSEGELCSEAAIQYFIYPQELAKNKLNYPGIEAFYEDK